MEGKADKGSLRLLGGWETLMGLQVYYSTLFPNMLVTNTAYVLDHYRAIKYANDAKW